MGGAVVEAGSDAGDAAGAVTSCDGAGAAGAGDAAADAAAALARA